VPVRSWTCVFLPEDEVSLDGIPTFDRFIEPLLRFLARHLEGAPARTAQEGAAAELGLSEAQKAQLLPQIALSGRAAVAFRREYEGPLPSHTGFKQLAIVREKQGDLDEVVRLSTRAIAEGWAGDWEARIARCEARRDRQRRKGADRDG